MSIKPELKFGQKYSELIEYLTKTAGLNWNTAQQHLIDVAGGLISPKYGLESLLIEPQEQSEQQETQAVAENITEPSPVEAPIPKRRGRPPKKL